MTASYIIAKGKYFLNYEILQYYIRNILKRDQLWRSVTVK